MPVRSHKSVATVRLKDILEVPVNSGKYSHQAVLTAKEATKRGHLSAQYDLKPLSISPSSLSSPRSLSSSSYPRNPSYARMRKL